MRLTCEKCGDDNFQDSGYADRMAEFAGYPVPVFFSEDGCNVVQPRTFGDIPSVYSSNMTSVLSGTIIYEWTEEVNNYGVITYPDTTLQDGVVVPVGSPIPISPDFQNLQAAWAGVSPTSIAMAEYTPTTSVGSCECPAITSGVWTIDGNAALPGVPGSLTPSSASSYTFTGTLSSVTVNTGTTTSSPSASTSTVAAASSSQSAGMFFSECD